MPSKKQILIAPLDWGLGHATRCMPIISALLAQNYSVTIAANGQSAKLLSQKFPALTIIDDIPNYNITYGKNKWHTKLKLVTQTLTINKAIKAENVWIKNYVEKNKIDIIISDNRYGLYHKNIKSVIITHQLAPISPIGSWVNAFLHKIIKNKIANFDACWIYDNAPPNSLAGNLSKINPLLLNHLFIGCHTRLKKVEKEKIYDFAFILSGPEPQRSILADIILQQLQQTNFKAVVVLGSNMVTIYNNTNIKVVQLANDEEISDLVAASKVIICRSGYTSVMDYLCIGAQCVLIPTPGQTEQEYLAQYLFDKNYCYTVPQHKLDIKSLPNQLSSFTFAAFDFKNDSLLLEAIKNL